MIFHKVKLFGGLAINSRLVYTGCVTIGYFFLRGDKFNVTDRKLMVWCNINI